MPLIALGIILRQLFPVGMRVQHFQPSVAREGAESVRKNAPAIERKTVLGPGRRGDDAAKATGFRMRLISRWFPKEFRMFKV